MGRPKTRKRRDPSKEAGKSQARERIPTRGADLVRGFDTVSQQRATGRALLRPPRGSVVMKVGESG
jgi:hypothetical protein